MKIHFNSIDDIVFCDQKIGRELGMGGFAKVKLVSHWDHPDKLFALKIIKKGNEEENKYMKQEAKLHATLSHPNIIEFYQFFETETNYYMVIEYA